VQDRVIIVHGWDGYPEEGWFPWLKDTLSGRGVRVSVPQMPHPDAPEISTWVAHLAAVVEEPTERTFLVGHSIGCQTILRYLASLSESARIGGALFVAGFFTMTNIGGEEEERIARPWLSEPIDDAAVQAHVGRMTAIFSDDDPYVPLENAQMFEKRYHLKMLVEHHQGHFSGSQGVTELPMVLRELLLLMGK